MTLQLLDLRLDGTLVYLAARKEAYYNSIDRLLGNDPVAQVAIYRASYSERSTRQPATLE